ALVDPDTGTLLLGAVASTGGADGERRGGDVDLHVVDLDRLGDETATRTVTLHAGLESDDHDNPALWRRADGRWLAVYSRHKSDDLTRWRISEGTDPPAGAPSRPSTGRSCSPPHSRRRRTADAAASPTRTSTPWTGCCTASSA